ncbi:hypothetical protein LINPERHAP2_LOCUS4302 [Linum perenne]
MRIVFCLITHAKLRGALMRLHIAWDRGLRKVELQVDVTTVIHLVEAEDDPRQQHAMKIMEFKDLLRHVFREGNRVADVALGFHLRYACLCITEPRLVF